MRSHVNGELSGLIKTFPTIRALIRSLSRVGAYVLLQLLFVLEAVIAVRTSVRLFLGMNLPMNAQGFFYSKTLIAYLAHKRSLSFKYSTITIVESF